MSIKAVDLNFVYGGGTAFEQHALFDVNLEIEDGEFVGLIGHTGSGKSTLIQHLKPAQANSTTTGRISTARAMT